MADSTKEDILAQTLKAARAFEDHLLKKQTPKTDPEVGRLPGAKQWWIGLGRRIKKAGEWEAGKETEWLRVKNLLDGLQAVGPEIQAQLKPILNEEYGGAHDSGTESLPSSPSGSPPAISKEEHQRGDAPDSGLGTPTNELEKEDLEVLLRVCLSIGASLPDIYMPVRDRRKLFETIQLVVQLAEQERAKQVQPFLQNENDELKDLTLVALKRQMPYYGKQHRLLRGVFGRWGISLFFALGTTLSIIDQTMKLLGAGPIGLVLALPLGFFNFYVNWRLSEKTTRNALSEVWGGSGGILKIGQYYDEATKAYRALDSDFTKFGFAVSFSFCLIAGGFYSGIGAYSLLATVSIGGAFPPILAAIVAVSSFVVMTSLMIKVWSDIWIKRQYRPLNAIKNVFGGIDEKFEASQSRRIIAKVLLVVFSLLILGSVLSICVLGSKDFVELVGQKMLNNLIINTRALEVVTYVISGVFGLAMLPGYFRQLGIFAKSFSNFLVSGAERLKAKFSGPKEAKEISVPTDDSEAKLSAEEPREKKLKVANSEVVERAILDEKRTFAFGATSVAVNAAANGTQVVSAVSSVTGVAALGWVASAAAFMSSAAMCSLGLTSDTKPKLEAASQRFFAAKKKIDAGNPTEKNADEKGADSPEGKKYSEEIETHIAACRGG